MQTNTYQAANGTIAVSDEELTFNGATILVIHDCAPRPTEVRALPAQHQAKYIKRLEDRGLNPDDYSVVDGHLIATKIADDYMTRIRNYDEDDARRKRGEAPPPVVTIDIGQCEFIRRPPRAEKYNAKWRLKRALNPDLD